MHPVLFLVCIVYIIFLPVLVAIVWYERQWAIAKAIWAKYGHIYEACQKQEEEFMPGIPPKLHKVSRRQVRKVIKLMCADLSLPQIKKIRLSPFCCGLDFVGIYIAGDTNDAELGLKGIFFFELQTLLHEISHHHAVHYFFTHGHGQDFLFSECCVFGAFQRLSACPTVYNHLTK